ITLFTNESFTPDADQEEALTSRGIRLETRRVVTLAGDLPGLTGVRLEDGDLIELDALFTASRTHLASPLAEQLGCELEEGPFGPVVRTDNRKETTVAGVFCAGDAAR